MSDPSAPVLLAVAPLGFNGRSVAVQGDYLVAGDSDVELLRVYSVRTPAAPQLVGTFVSWATALQVAGNHAFVAAYLWLGVPHTYTVVRPPRAASTAAGGCCT